MVFFVHLSKIILTLKCSTGQSSSAVLGCLSCRFNKKRQLFEGYPIKSIS